MGDKTTSCNALAIVELGMFDGPGNDWLYPSLDETGSLILGPGETALASFVTDHDPHVDGEYFYQDRKGRRRRGLDWSFNQRSQIDITAERLVVSCQEYATGSVYFGTGVVGGALAVGATAISKARAASEREGKAAVCQIRFEWVTRLELGDTRTIEFHVWDAETRNTRATRIAFAGDLQNWLSWLTTLVYNRQKTWLASFPDEHESVQQLTTNYAAWETGDKRSFDGIRWRFGTHPCLLINADGTPSLDSVYADAGPPEGFGAHPLAELSGKPYDLSG